MFNIFNCCGKTAKPVAKAIAFIDLMMAIAVGLTGLLLVSYYPHLLLSQKDIDEKTKSTPIIVSIILLAAFFFLEACLFVVLQSATRDRDAGQSDNWFKIRLILLCIFIFAVIYWLMYSVNVSEIYIAGGVCLFVVLYRVYALMVVRAFYMEIMTEQQLDLGRVLTKI